MPSADPNEFYEGGAEEGDGREDFGLRLDTRMKRLDVNLESNIFSLYRSLNIKDMNYIIKHFVSHQFLLRVIDKNIASENRAVLLNQKEIRLNVGLGNGKSMYSNDGSPSLVTGHNNKHYKPATC